MEPVRSGRSPSPQDPSSSPPGALRPPPALLAATGLPFSPPRPPLPPPPGCCLPPSLPPPALPALPAPLGPCRSPPARPALSRRAAAGPLPPSAGICSVRERGAAGLRQAQRPQPWGRPWPGRGRRKQRSPQRRRRHGGEENEPQRAGRSPSPRLSRPLPSAGSITPPTCLTHTEKWTSPPHWLRPAARSSLRPGRSRLPPLPSLPSASAAAASSAGRARLCLALPPACYLSSSPGCSPSSSSSSQPPAVYPGVPARPVPLGATGREEGEGRPWFSPQRCWRARGARP